MTVSHLFGALSHSRFMRSYSWSLVFAADMYATVFKADPLDPERGKRYRDKILLPGASRDEMDLLEVSAVIAVALVVDAVTESYALPARQDFLGRPPNTEAFTEMIFGGSG